MAGYSQPAHRHTGVENGIILITSQIHLLIFFTVSLIHLESPLCIYLSYVICRLLNTLKMCTFHGPILHILAQQQSLYLKKKTDCSKSLLYSSDICHIVFLM